MMQAKSKLAEHGAFKSILLPRKIDAHKGSHGSVAIIGGDTGMVGAVLLASRAALLAGAGRTYAALLAQDAPLVDSSFPELMLRPLVDLEQLSQLDCLAIGPGLGVSIIAIDVLEHWLLQQKTLVLDADALNLIARHAHLALLVKNRRAETVITPHVGEAARLLSGTVDTVLNNRVDCAMRLANTLNAICVLKGAGTITALPNGHYYVNSTGNPALASGGTGDVLTGVISSLIAQGLTAQDAARLGVFVHGAAADNLVARALGPIGITASEVALEVRGVINQLTYQA